MALLSSALLGKSSMASLSARPGSACPRDEPLLLTVIAAASSWTSCSCVPPRWSRSASRAGQGVVQPCPQLRRRSDAGRGGISEHDPFRGLDRSGATCGAVPARCDARAHEPAWLSQYRTSKLLEVRLNSSSHQAQNKNRRTRQPHNHLWNKVTNEPARQRSRPRSESAGRRFCVLHPPLYVVVIITPWCYTAITMELSKYRYVHHPPTSM